MENGRCIFFFFMIKVRAKVSKGCRHYKIHVLTWQFFQYRIILLLWCIATKKPCINVDTYIVVVNRFSNKLEVFVKMPYT